MTVDRKSGKMYYNGVPGDNMEEAKKTMKLLETKNTTYAIATQYHLTTIFRDNEKIKSFTREIHHDGVTYSEYVMLHEFDRKHNY